jgi:tetratricopeptide (TPR) repeat protein
VLVRDAAYDSLPKAVRAEIHRRFADRLAGSAHGAGAELAAFQAHHLEQALRLQREISAAPPVVAELTERAVAALIAAAHAADHTDNLAAATELTERACALLPPADRRSRRLLFRLAYMVMDHFQVARARVLAGRLDELVVVGGDADELERLALEALRGRVALAMSEPLDPSVFGPVAERLVALARAAGDTDALAAGLRAATEAAWMRGHWQRVYEISTELAAAPGVRGAYFAQSLRETAAWGGPMPVREALAVCTGAPRDPAAPATRILQAQLNHLVLLALDGQLDAAFDMVTRVQATRSNVGDDTVDFFVSHVRLAAGDLEGAMSLISASAERNTAAGALGSASTSLAELARLLLRLGRTAEALPVLERAESITSPFDPISMACCLGCRAVLAALNGRLDDADELADDALRHVDSTDQLVDQADLRRFLAGVARARGDLVGERALLTAARERYAAKGARPFLAETEEELRELDARAR